MSKWTDIYYDNLNYYIRLVPDFMELEKSGFSHGISIGNIHFDNLKDAETLALEFDKFFEQMEIEILREQN